MDQPTTHPCERVFGSCKGGQECKFKDAPRDACVTFLKGKCRFGARCAEPHFIQYEGKYIGALHPCLRVFNGCKFGDACEYASYPSTTCIKFLRGKCSFGPRCKEHHPGVPQGLEGGAFGYAGAVGKRGRDGFADFPGAKRPQLLTGGLHPCQRVFGQCLAGPSCKFALFPAECCVRYLKGDCKFGDTCKETHVDTAKNGKHPCARIYGFCKVGCRFSDFPAESCLQFLKGRCKFGDSCRELHAKPVAETA